MMFTRAILNQVVVKGLEEKRREDIIIVMEIF